MARTLKRARAAAAQKDDKKGTKKAKVIDGLKLPVLGKRHSNRTRVQTVMHQAPNFLKKKDITSMKQPKVKKLIAKTPVKKGRGKVKKTAAGKIPPKQAGGKVQKKKGTKNAQPKAAGKGTKKGNERLVPRDGVPKIEVNPFLYRASPEPEYISVDAYYRRLIRAIARKDTKELANFFKSNKNIRLENLDKYYSYGCPLSALQAVLQTKDIAFMTEYFKNLGKIDNSKKRFKEPNLLQKKSSGRSNFYMLGRATRAVEMTRGGKEGNNAFLTYEAQDNYNQEGGLFEAGLSYSEMVAIMKIKGTPFNEYCLQNHVVTACRKGDIKLASALAEGPSSINFNDLHRATLKTAKLPAKILPISVLKKGYNNRNITPIHTAAINPDPKMLETLRSVDPNINIPDQNNWYTIHYAAVCEGPKPLEYLLKNGASISTLTKQQESPLHVAARAGRAHNIPIILREIDVLEKPSNPANPIKPQRSLMNARTREGKAALHYAVESGDIDTIKALLANEKVLIDNPTSTNHNKLSPLMIACAFGNLELVKFLIEKGALVEGKDKKKRTPLTHAVMNGQAHVAAYLLKLGADMRKGDSSGNRPAHYAAAYGFLEELKLLCETDSDCLTDENDWKITPLFVAYMKGHHGIVQWMFFGPHKDKVDVNAKDNEGVTLLSSLLRYYDGNFSNLLKDMEFLIKSKADCGVPDGLGYNALHVFAKMKIPLKMPGMKIDDDTDVMDIEEYKQCYRMLVSNGASLEQKTTAGETPLQLALEGGNLILFEEMLNYQLPHSNIDFTKIFDEWSTSKTNVLFSLFRVPCEVWKSARGTSLHQSQFDVPGILRGKFKEYCKGNYKKWLTEKDTEGFTPAMMLLREYCKLRPNKSDIPTQHEFVNSVNELFGWCLAWDPSFLTAVHTHDKRSYSLLHSSLYVHIERDKLELRLLKSIIEIAVSGKQLHELLLVPGLHELPFVVHALFKPNIKALELVLKESKKAGCTTGVHDAVLHNVKKADGTDERVEKTLAMLMVEKCEFDLLRELVVPEAYWNMVDTEGNTIWHYAARSNHHRTVGVLRQLDERRVPRRVNANGWTALHVAVNVCDGSANAVLEPIEWLAIKEDVGAQDKYRRTALHYAFVNENEYKEDAPANVVRDPIAVVSILSNVMTKQQINLQDENGNTVLHMAALMNSNISAVTLLRRGADVNIKNKIGNTPLAIAALHGKQSVALTLIQANSSVIEQVIPRQPKDDAKKTEWIWDGVKKTIQPIPSSSIPAEIVSKGQGYEAMVYVLLDVLGKNPNSLAQLTDAAIRQQQFNLANQLLKSLEAYLDGKPLKSNYDLLQTFSENLKNNSLQPESITLTILERILVLGGKISQNGMSKPIETALLNGSWPLVDYFKTQLGAEWKNLKPSDANGGPIKSIVTNLSRYVTSEGEKYLEELMTFRNLSINASLDFEIPGKFARQFETCRMPAIAWAALCGHHKLIVLLRNAKVNVNATDTQGRTPLMYAIIANDEKSLNALLGNDLEIAIPHAKIHNVIDKVKRPKFANFLSGKSAKMNGIITNGNANDNDNDDGDDSNADSDEESDNQSENPSESDDGTDKSETGSEDNEDKEQEVDNDNGEPSNKKIKLSYKNKELNLAARDKEGRTFAHYLVIPIAWENAELLNNIYKMEPSATKTAITTKDKNGIDAMELAVRNKQRMLYVAMQKIVGVGKKAKAPVAIESSLSDVSNLKCNYDVNADADQYMKRWAAERDQKIANEVPKPHKNSGYKDTGDVVFCDETKQHMNVLLNITDLNYGRYGFHNFYRMQLIKRRDTNLWILFTNWGRIGSGDGEYQVTPFGSFELGAKEFKSIWKQKTGNEWVNLASFREIPKKYHLFKVNTMPYNLAEIELPVEKFDDKLPLVDRSISDISNPAALKSYAKQMSRNLKITCPFGRITIDSISKGKKVLNELEKTLERLDKTLIATHTDSDILNIHWKINDLTSQFYSLIPSGEYEYTNLERFTDLDKVNNARRSLNRLEEVEVAARILTAAEENRGKVDRLIYIKNALQCKFEALSPKEEMSQRILEAIHNTGGENITVKGIIAISPKDATLKFAKHAADTNQMFLWHGTKAVNLLSILRDGYLLDPLNSARTGRLFGDGLYLSDAFEKSNNYCVPSKEGLKYMLLNQVAMGKVQKIASVNRCSIEEADKKWKEDTLHVSGRRQPSYTITVEGVRMPIGHMKEVTEMVSGHSWYHWQPELSEFIARSCDRVLPRFIVIYE